MSAEEVKRGDMVRIPKGTVIEGTFPDRIKEAGRAYVVTVHAVDRYDSGDKVCWVGAGGYWHYALLADVQPLVRDEVAG